MARNFVGRLRLTCGWRRIGAPDTLEPSLVARLAPSMAQDGPAHRPSATRMNSKVRLRWGVNVETATFICWTTHPGGNAQCVGSREVGRAFSCTVDARHQGEVAACDAGPSRARDGAWRAPTVGSSAAGVTHGHLRRDFSTASPIVRLPPIQQHDPSLEPLPIGSIQASTEQQCRWR